jgi:hypothetical protein
MQVRPYLSLADYLIPTATDYPNIRAIALENHRVEASRRVELAQRMSSARKAV